MPSIMLSTIAALAASQPSFSRTGGIFTVPMVSVIFFARPTMKRSFTASLICAW